MTFTCFSQAHVLLAQGAKGFREYSQKRNFLKVRNLRKVRGAGRGQGWRSKSVGPEVGLSPQPSGRAGGAGIHLCCHILGLRSVKSGLHWPWAYPPVSNGVFSFPGHIFQGLAVVDACSTRWDFPEVFNYSTNINCVSDAVLGAGRKW